MQTALHPEGNLSSRTQEHQEGEQRQHSPQDFLLCKGHPVSRTWATTGQIQGLQSVHEESDTCTAQGPGTHGEQTLREQASVYSRSHCQRKVSCLEAIWFTSTVWAFLFPLLQVSQFCGCAERHWWCTFDALSVQYAPTAQEAAGRLTFVSVRMLLSCLCLHPTLTV